MGKYKIIKLDVDGYDRFATIKINPNLKINVSFLENNEYLDMGETSKIRKEGDYIQGSITIIYASIIRKQDGMLTFIQQITDSPHIEAVVEVVELIDKYSFYAQTSILSDNILIEFEREITCKIRDKLYIDGECHLEI